MTSVPCIQTERLRLREITAEDHPFFEKLYGDPVCMTYYPAVKSPSETAEWLRRLAYDSYRDHGFGLWAVVGCGGRTFDAMAIRYLALPLGVAVVPSVRALPCARLAKWRHCISTRGVSAESGEHMDTDITLSHSGLDK